MSDALDKLFRPSSIAVVGASATPGKRGNILIAHLNGICFSGRVYPVNARYDEVLGHKCYASLEALPAVPDVVAVCVGAQDVPDIVEECGRVGVKAVAVVSASFADNGAAGLELQRRMLVAAERYGIAIMGPNGLGLLNRLDSVQYWLIRPPGADYLKRDTPSGASAIVQSGSISMSIMVDARERGLIFDHVISAGNQASIDTADYIEWLLDRSGSPPRVIGAVIEGVGKPEKLKVVCQRALTLGTAIVLLKAGRDASVQEFVASHTGALIGSAEVFDQVLARHGAIVVEDIDEWLEQLLVMAHPVPATGDRWCMITTSGGGNAMIADMANAMNLAIPPATSHLSAAMRKIADRPVLNPLDAGGYYDAPGRYTKAVTAASEDPDLDVVLACLAWYPGADEPSHELLDAALTVAAAREKPIFIFSFSIGPVPENTLSRLRAVGLYPLRGARSTLRAMQRLFWWLNRRASPGAMAPIQATASGGSPSSYVNIDPGIARQALEAAGLAVPTWRYVAGADAAVEAAHSIGSPVVLKVEHADLLHKTEIGGVVLNLSGTQQVTEAFQRLQRDVVPQCGHADARITIQKQMPAGLEVLLSVQRDPIFGLYLAVGLGGIFAELLQDVVVRPLPLRREDIEAMLSELRGFALFSGYRGGRPFDRIALVDAALCLSEFADRHGADLETLEINPMIVLPDRGGAWVADVVMRGVARGKG